MNKINIPLSGNDIILKLNGKVNIYSYSQIFNFKNINELYKNHKYLLELLYNSQKEIHYNQYQLQNKAPEIQTCGRWCILRLKYPSISVDNFYNIFKDTSKVISNDELVSILI